MRNRVLTIAVWAAVACGVPACRRDADPEAVVPPAIGERGPPDRVAGQPSPVKIKLRTALPGAGIPFALTHDGKTLATDINYDTVRLWDVDTGMERPRLQGATNPIGLTPDGKILAACRAKEGRRGHDIALWDVVQGKALQTLRGNTDFVHCMTFTPDGRRLASGSADGTIRLWDVATGEQRGTLGAGGQGVSSLAFSRDGLRLASGGYDNRLRMWDVSAAKELWAVDGPANLTYVHFVFITADRKTVAWASAHGHPIRAGESSGLILTDAVTGKERQTVKDIGWARAVTDDAKTLLSIRNDDFPKMRIELCDVASTKAWRTHEGNVREVASGNLTPDGKTLLLWTETYAALRPIEVWDVTANKKLRAIQGKHTRWVREAVLSANGKTLAAVGFEREMKLWDVASGKERGTVTGVAEPLAFVTDDGQTLASAPAGVVNVEPPSVKLWDLATTKELRAIPGLIPPVEVSADGKVLAAGSPNGALLRTETDEIKLWALPSGKLINSVRIEGYTVKSLGLDRNGGLLAVAGVRTEGEPVVKFWETATGKQVGHLKGFTKGLHGLALAPDGKTLATVEEEVKIWDVNKGVVLVRFQPPKYAIVSLVFSPDSKTLATGYDDGKDPTEYDGPGSIRLWDVATGQERGSVQDPTGGGVRSLMFTADGGTLVSSGRSEVKLWDVIDLSQPKLPK